MVCMSKVFVQGFETKYGTNIITEKKWWNI